jgi:hypothetical protein
MFLVLMSQQSEAVQDSSLRETLDRAVDYLVSNYSATMGLIPEVPNGTTYWLYSDNFLASYVLGNYDPNNLTLATLSTNISDTIFRYMLPFPNMSNQYMVLNSSIWAFNNSSDYTIEKNRNTSINATFNNGTYVLSSSDYVDVAFLKALYFNSINQTTQALNEYLAGVNLFNGKGMNDTAFQTGKSKGRYQTFKIALFIYVSKILQHEYPQDLQTILLRMNTTSGGFYSGYDENFLSNGTDTNVETTCLAILALKEPVIPEFGYRVLGIALVISTALIILLQKSQKFPEQHTRVE